MAILVTGGAGYIGSPQRDSGRHIRRIGLSGNQLGSV